MNHALYRRALAAVTVLLVAVPSVASASVDRAPQPAVRGVLAEFEGTTINLAVSWGDAHACAVSQAATMCYRSEAEMNAASVEQLSLSSSAAPTEAGVGDVSIAAACSSSLRLYDGTSYGGNTVNFTTRGALISLSSYGFDNLTSSYKVGACAATLYSGIQSGTYPGNTGAGAQATSMLSGWNNVISSVYIA